MRFQISTRIWTVMLAVVGFLLVFNSFYYSSEAKTISIKRRSVETNRIHLRYDIIKLFEKTNQALEFFETNFDQLNPDGLFGVRIAQGSFVNASSKIYQSQGEIDFTWLLNLFKNRLDKLANKAYESVRENEPEYANAFDVFISRPYFPGFVKETSIKNYIEKNSANFESDRDSSFNEKFSDYCYMSLLNENEQCLVDSNCLKYYADRRASGYFLTHQLLFVLVAQKSKCGEITLLNLVSNLLKDFQTKNDLKEIINRNPQKDFIKYALVEYYCGRIYMEVMASNQTFFNTGRLPDGIDLFTEQLLLCTLANVKEFKTNNFLETIYSFQNRFGCFGEEDDNNRKNMISLLKRKHDINRKEIDTLSSLLENERERRRRRRVRREDKLMNNGCSSHATGLALGYYSTLIAVNLEQIDNN